jgi:GT2 family glycosyltransferase
LNFQSLGRALAELSPKNNAIPRLAYLASFLKRKIKDRRVDFDEGFSLVLPTRNRTKFLCSAVTAVISNTQLPFELLIMDNASDDETREVCQTFERKHPGVVRHIRLTRNYGTNAYALGFLQAKYKYLVDMDDDILALSKGWDRSAIAAFRRFPRLGFLAMNVVQDKYTNGGKHEISKYSELTVADTTLEVGPTGGWFAVTTRSIYNDVGGFIFSPYKPFPAEDGNYVRKLTKNGYFAGILRKTFVYHASGPYWNGAYGYSKSWDEKYQRHHKDLLPLIREIQIDEVPTPQYAQAMVIMAEQRYAAGGSTPADGGPVVTQDCRNLGSMSGPRSPLRSATYEVLMPINVAPPGGPIAAFRHLEGEFRAEPVKGERSIPGATLPDALGLKPIGAAGASAQNHRAASY